MTSATVHVSPRPVTRSRLGRRTRVACVLLAAAVLVTACRQAPRTPPPDEEGEALDPNAPIPVAAQAAQVGTLRALIHVSGTVVPADGAEFLVVAPEPARIVDVTRNVGEPVSVGDVLVRFELPNVQQEVSRVQADLSRAQAQLENTRATRTRVADFVERGLVPRNDLAQADREVIDAENAVNVANTALARAQATLARATVRAPFAGIVVNRLHNPGDLAQGLPTDPVLRIIDPQRLEVLAAIPGKDASRVLPGATARVAGAIDGQTATLSVAARPGGTPDAAGTLRVRLVFTSPHMLMVDGPIEIDIDGEERANAVFVPLTALVSQEPDAAVFIASGEVATRRRVTTGVTSDLGVEITSGLQAGELVIVRGQANVTDGSRISADVVR